MLVLIAIISYLLGSIPAGFIIGKLVYKTDIRKMGSGNIGTTNAFRNFGKYAGFATFSLDFFKGILACHIGKLLACANGIYIAMFFVVIGHMFSFLLRFKAGKGVATIFGSLMYINPVFALTLFTIFLILLFLSRIVSFASISLAIIAIIYGLISFGINLFTISLSILSIIILIKHQDNFKRLVKKEEKKMF